MQLHTIFMLLHAISCHFLLLHAISCYYMPFSVKHAIKDIRIQLFQSNTNLRCCVASLSSSVELFQLINTNFSQSFIIGIYIIAFGAVIGLLEFRVPSEAYTYGSFLFSFIGRGIFYILIGASINHSSIFRLLSSLLVILAGVGFLVLETIPSISPPDNMNAEGISVGIEDEDIV